MASGDMAQSMKTSAAPALWEPLTSPVASRSQPTPSLGTITSTGSPSDLAWAPRKSIEIPMGISPRAASLQGLEPEWT